MCFLIFVFRFATFSRTWKWDLFCICDLLLGVIFIVYCLHGHLLSVRGRHGDRDGISLAVPEKRVIIKCLYLFWTSNGVNLNTPVSRSVVWCLNMGVWASFSTGGFIGDTGGPPFTLLHPSLCASSLRRSLVSIRDNTHMQTHLHQAGILYSYIPLARYTTPRWHTSTHTVASPWPQSLPAMPPQPCFIWALFHTCSIFWFIHSTFLLSASV